MYQQQTQKDPQYRSPIIDKIIIYGVRNPQNLTISQIRLNEISVGILRCFTYNRETLEIVETTQIEEDKYQMWVYPDGIHIYDSNYQIINDPQPQFSFTGNNVINMKKVLKINDDENNPQPLDTFYPFVLTDYELNRTYCTCLMFNEKRFVENDEDEITNPAELENTVTLKPKNANKIANLNSKILPKCTLNQLIQDPLVLDPTSSLVYIAKGIIICSSHPCLTFQRDIISFLYMNGIKKHGDASIHKKEMDQVRNLIAKFGYPQAQKFYDEEQFLNQRQQRLRKQQKQLPIKPYQLHSKKTYLRMQREKKQNQLNLKNLRRLQKKKLEQFYLSLAFLPELIQSKNQLQTPTQVILIEDTITLNNQFSFQPYYFSSTCFRMPNFNILQTISKIGINNLLTLWKNAILERQILVFSSDQFLTIELFETLLYLLQPLKWENIYIPFLPFHLCHHIEALGGYLIGMSKIHMNYMIEHFNLQSKVFVDLDQMIIIEEGGNADTQLPAEIQKWMIQQLQKLGFENKQKKTSYGTDTLWSFSFSRLVNKQDEKQQPSTQSQQKTIRTIFELHKIFYISIFYIMNNYSSYIIEDGNAIRFNRQQYLKIYESQQDRKFSSQLIKTMMFIRLCEFHKNAQKSLKWNQSDICSLFVYCHYIMKVDKNDIQYWNIGYFGEQKDNAIVNSQIQGAKNNPQRLNQYIDYVIQRNINELTSAMTEWKTYKVQHYLVKYLNYINYKSPGIIKMQQAQFSHQQSSWLSWLWQMIQTQQVQKQQKVKKEKLNRMNDFFNRQKTIVDLNKLFKNIGSDLFGSLRKNLGLNGWTNAKVIEKMKYNRDNAKSSQSVQ